jgi:hypothetical protein
MKLPIKCPHRRSAKNWLASDDAASPCCRVGDFDMPVFLPRQGPLCRGMDRIVEAYRFVWRGSFDGDVLVQVRRGEKSITLDWTCRSFKYGDGRFWRCIESADWTRLETGLLAAGFWAISPDDERRGLILDGANWVIEGRRRDVYRAVRRASPRGPIHNLGRVFLDIAGPPIAEIRLY